MANFPHAAQLYTVREQVKEDFPGVLRALKKMGWSGVQISGLHGYPLADIAEVVKETGLGVAGMHVPLNRLTTDLPQVVEEARAFATRDVVCPALPESLRVEDGYREVRQRLNGIAAELARQDLRLSYHNHAFEFATVVDGKSALAYLLEPSAANLLLAEPDVYWIARGGEDPVRFIQPYKDRMPLIHLKDMTDDERRTFAEVGTGVLDFPALLSFCRTAGVEWYIVEQDVCPGDPLDSLAVSLENLRRLADMG